MSIEFPIWIYWLGCGLAAVLLRLNQQRIPVLLSPDFQVPQTQKQGYWLTLGLGWVATAVAAICYILLTQKEVSGFYTLTDLTVFTFINGCLEQFMFIFWLLAGCWLAKQIGVIVSWKVFGLGFLSYAIFSGAIHALFWINVLPQHHPSPFMPFILVAMSYLWMWLFWRYQAILAIIAMHMMIDFLTIGHLHFPWFGTAG